MKYKKIAFDELPEAVRVAFAGFKSDNTAAGSTTAVAQYKVRGGYAIEVKTGGFVYYRPDGKRN